MPLVDGVVEGDVVPAVHNGENVAVNGKFFDDLANGIVDLNDDMNATNASVASLQGEVAGKQDALTTSADLSISDNNELSLTDMAKKRLFIDMFNTAAKGYGKYNIAAALDTAKPFHLYDMWLSYEEALDTYTQWISIAYSPATPNNTVKALLPISMNASGYGNYLDARFKFGDAPNLEVVAFAGYRGFIINDSYMFANCSKLRSVLGSIVFNVAATTVFNKCSSLKDITIWELHKNINFAFSPLLSLDSVSFMVQHATNDSPITITVHPDVYAKLTDTLNAEWYAVLTTAAAKNISFATI